MATDSPPTKAEYFILPTTSSPTRQRTLAYNFYGSTETSARTVLYFHGYPSSHVEAALYHPFALAQNLRLLAITRPGYGESTYDPHRQLLDWPSDILAVVDHLQIQKFGIIGISGGGPYVFACLNDARLKDRILAAAVVCGLYPSELGLQGMNFKHRLMINSSAWFPSIFTYLLRTPFQSLAAKDAAGDDGAAVEAFLSAEMESLPAQDQVVWKANEHGFKTAMIVACRTMIRNPHAADTTAQEAGFFGRPWGFDLRALNERGELNGKLALWHGTEDLNIGCRMAKKASEVLGERVELRMYEGEGHGSLASRKGGEVTAWVGERMRKGEGLARGD